MKTAMFRRLPLLLMVLALVAKAAPGFSGYLEPGGRKSVVRVSDFLWSRAPVFRELTVRSSSSLRWSA